MHLSMSDVEALVSGGLQAAERRRAVRHLLSGCRLCGGRLAAAAPDLFFGGNLPATSEDQYDEAIDRAAATAKEFLSRWQNDRRRLARGLELVRRSPEGYDGLSFEQVQELQGRPLVEALLKLSFDIRYQDRKRMRWLAYNAMIAAEGLRPEEYGRGFTCDLRARAWAELANAYRVNDEFAAAEEAFARAREWLRQGTGDPLLLARVADLEASLRRAQRRLDEACELLDAAARLYRKLGDDHLLGRMHLSKGITLHYRGDPRQAAQILRDYLPLLDPEREPELPDLCLQALVHALVDSGELSEAGRLLLHGGLRRHLLAEPLVLLKLRWAEGKLLAGIGKLPSAERALVEVRNGFLERRCDYEAALAGLDLASVWLRQNKARQALQLSQGMLATFQSLGIRREALRARRYLEEASQAV